MKTIFCDLDGTLLKDDKSISKQTVEAIKSLKRNNVNFVICTGRGPQGVYHILDILGELDVIYYSGAYIEEARRKIYSDGFTKDEARIIGNFLEKNNFKYSYFSEKLWISPEYSQELSVEEFLVKNKSIIAPLDYIEDGSIINKVQLMCGKNSAEECQKIMMKAFPNYAHTNSLDYVIEITKKNISKGNACKIYCDIKNIDLADTICFGDGYNDISMFDTVGTAYIMNNAKDVIKNKYTNIVPSNEDDGVYKTLRKLNLC